MKTIALANHKRAAGLPMPRRLPARRRVTWCAPSYGMRCGSTTPGTSLHPSRPWPSPIARHKSELSVPRGWGPKGWAYAPGTRRGLFRARGHR